MTDRLVYERPKTWRRFLLTYDGNVGQWSNNDTPVHTRHRNCTADTIVRELVVPGLMSSTPPGPVVLYHYPLHHVDLRLVSSAASTEKPKWPVFPLCEHVHLCAWSLSSGCLQAGNLVQLSGPMVKDHCEGNP